MSDSLDSEGTRLPIKIDSTSNGEFIPRPLDHHSQVANSLAHDWASDNAKRRGQSRRAFLMSTCGVASTLTAFNHAHAALGKAGGFYDVPKEAALDAELAQATLESDDFIFDIQSHHLGPLEAWTEDSARYASRIGFKFIPHGSCDYALPDAQIGHLNCYTSEAFIKEIFMDSDTDIAVLTFTPTTEEKMPLTTSEAAATRETLNALNDGGRRLLLHGRVIPNLPGDLDRMSEIQEQWGIAAWKTYTQFSPNNDTGWWLDGEYGNKLAENARQIGVNLICVHKGLPLPSMGKENREYGLCRDVGPAARQNPDISYIVYHSGFDPDKKEGAFERGNPVSGIDSLIESVLDSEIGLQGNVYAELGSTWRYLLRDPDEAAHAIGKLLKYVGEDRVVWGTDSIWYGSPQDQIQAFRTFQISQAFQEEYGYPEITPAIRTKVFGLNAAVPYGLDSDEIKSRAKVDTIGQLKQAYLEQPDPSFMTYGPKTRREFFDLMKLTGGL